MRSRAERPTPTSTTRVLPETRPRCLVCGGTVTTGSRYCLNCVPIVNRENLLAQAKLGRIATHRPSAEARRSATQRKQFDAIRSWNRSELPGWLNEKAYKREILPRLSKFTVKAIRLALDVCLTLTLQTFGAVLLFLIHGTGLSWQTWRESVTAEVALRGHPNPANEGHLKTGQ